MAERFDESARRPREVYVRICEVCDREFETTRKDRKSCSNRCRANASRSRAILEGAPASDRLLARVQLLRQVLGLPPLRVDVELSLAAQLEAAGRAAGVAGTMAQLRLPAHARAQGDLMQLDELDQLRSPLLTDGSAAWSRVGVGVAPAREGRVSVCVVVA